jgi:hypothetical protein
MVMVAFRPGAVAGGMGEKGKIEALIVHIEGLKDASFVRNGRSYDSQTAGKFLRGKWEANAREIKTASDFIEKAASVSSTSHQPYVIRFKDGREQKCGEYLRGQLAKMEKAAK